MVALLIDRGAKIDAKDADGLTALMIAAGEGHLEMVEVLVKRGARVDARDKRGRAALDLAKAGHFPDVAKAIENFADRGSVPQIR